MAVGPKIFQLAFTKTRNECGTSFTWLFHPKIVHKIWTIKKPDADTVQYGATPPSVSESQVMNGLGFFVFLGPKMPSAANQ